MLLGGRPTVGLQTLDLPIGVRIPASQPILQSLKLRILEIHFDAQSWEPLRLGQATRILLHRLAKNANESFQDKHPVRLPRPSIASTLASRTAGHQLLLSSGFQADDALLFRARLDAKLSGPLGTFWMILF